MVYGILCRNSQDGNGQEFYTFDQVSYKVKKIESCLIFPEILLSLNDFSLRCFLIDKLESSVRPLNVFVHSLLPQFH